MNYYRLNQIAMAVLGALLLFFGTKTIIEIANEEHEPAKPGMEVAGAPEHKPADEAAPATPAGGGASEVVALMATADPKQGEADAGLCKVCHTFDKGGASVVGPNLYGVVGRKIASVEGFAYTGLKAKAGGDWDYAALDHWLENPQAFAPGTTMAFPGFPEAKKRADVIAFLRIHADTPAPLPEAGAAPAPAEAPKTEVPAEAPKAEAPAAEAPAAPAAEAPAAETPAAPAAEEPKTEAPAAEEPKAEAPAMDAPAAETAPTAGEGQSAPAENSAPATPQ